jgi:hypothetical protein
MKFAKFDEDGFLIIMAENISAQDNPDFVPVPEDSDANNLFLNSEGVPGPREELTLNCDRTVILTDGKDAATITGLPKGGCTLVVNGVRTRVKGSSYKVTSTSGSVIVTAGGAYWSNLVSVRAGTADDIMNEVRVARDALLAASDWTQMPDAALTDDVKKAWADYRTALRNITSDQPNATIDTVIWPTKPA